MAERKEIQRSNGNEEIMTDKIDILRRNKKEEMMKINIEGNWERRDSG